MDPGLRAGDRVTSEGTRAEAGGMVSRFGVGTRLVHWGLAIPFVLLLLTGVTNFWPEVKAIQVADVRLFAWLHVVLGFGMVGVAVVLVAGVLPRKAVRADAIAVADLRLDDYLWLQHQGLRLLGETSKAPPARKFNGGQKLNALASAGATLGLLGTGVVLGINYTSKEVFTVGFVEPVFRWHTLLALAFVPLLLAHVYLAVAHPSTRESLRGMTRGFVRREWARRHHRAWVDDLDRREAR